MARILKKHDVRLNEIIGAEENSLSLVDEALIRKFFISEEE